MIILQLSSNKMYYQKHNRYILHLRKVILFGKINGKEIRQKEE